MGVVTCIFSASGASKNQHTRCVTRLAAVLASAVVKKNIHAVTGVKWGFRLVLLVWTRPPDAEVPEDQKHVCYFRPGTGLSVWLTTGDLCRYEAEQKQSNNRSPSPTRKN